MISFPFNEVIEAVCLYMAFRFLSNEKLGYLRQFRWFMLLTVLVESAGFTIRLIYHLSNHWLYNLYLPIEISFISWVLYKVCIPYFKVKKVLIPGLVIAGGLYLFESLKSQFTEYSLLSNSVASLMIILICCLYFYYFLKKEEYVNIYKHYPFWLVTGLFFFYLGTSACNVFYDYLASINFKQNLPVRYMTFVVFNFILYSCWSYAFLCRYRQTT